jgi:murein DD-endopeptidase MepM/ murein hydrolase activator NlpD
LRPIFYLGRVGDWIAKRRENEDAMTTMKKRPLRLIGPALAVAALCAVAVGCAGSHRGTVQVPDVASVQPEPPSPVTVEGYITDSGVYHVVQPGQTLWRIATAYGVPLDEIARTNGIENASMVLSGQSLFIPGKQVLLDVPPYPAPLSKAPVEFPTAKNGTTAFDWPVSNGRIVSAYGAHRRTHRHKGLDIGAAHGDPVLAARSGRVVYSGSTLRGYGKTVILDHGDRFRTLYAHNSALLVREGDWVEKGHAIARIGRTGNASGEHCHFEIRKNEVPVDPMAYLPATTGSVR